MLRLPPPPELADLVVHFWVPEWDLPPGRVERQLVLTYPVVNLVVEPDAVTVHGPHTSVSHRDLSGRGWAVGALLRPAAVPAVLATTGSDPAQHPTKAPATPSLSAPASAASLVDGQRRLDEPRLLAEVSHAMRPGAGDRQARAAAVLGHWISERKQAPDRDGQLANAGFDLIEADPGVTTVTELARRLAVSTRTLQRISLRHNGFTPGALIRRRRLQGAADRLRQDPDADLAALAHELGYADHAHLTREFRHVLGVTPSDYRSGSTGSAGSSSRST